jgi:excisionase family DNA binding protein
MSSEHWLLGRSSLAAEFRMVRAQSYILRRVVVEVPIVAALFGVDQRTIRRALESGQIRGIRLGDKTLVPTAQLREMLGVDLAEGEDPDGEEQLPESVQAKLYEVLPQVGKAMDDIFREAGS